MINKRHLLSYSELTHEAALQTFDFVQSAFARMYYGSELIFNETPYVCFELTKHVLQVVARARP